MSLIRVLLILVAYASGVAYAARADQPAATDTAAIATSQHKFYPLGYVPPATLPTAQQAQSVRRLYPLGYVPPPAPPIASTTTPTVAPLPGVAEKRLMPAEMPPPAEMPLPVTARAAGAAALIRVGLVLNASAANIVALDDLELRDNVASTSLGVLPASSIWRVTACGAQLKFELIDLKLGILPGNNDTNTTPGARRESFAVPAAVEYSLTPRVQDGLSGLNGKAYRGALLLRSSCMPGALQGISSNTFCIINVLNLEDYLLSVVPSEMPSSWPAEALKAQAIAARSYALANLGKHGSQGYDVKADTEDQMYTGVLAETVSGNRAVAQTAGIIIKNQGKVVPAFYHSTSGGSTETARGKDYPFLQEVADYDDASPKFTWTKKLSAYELEQALKGRTHPIGQLQNIEVLSRSPSNHNIKILVTGSTGSIELSGDQARGIFGLPSSNFNVMLADEVCVFSGRGFGHRMGLSQWGAKALAEHGYNAAQILSYYYKDVSLDYP